MAIGIGVDGNRLDAHFRARALDTNCDLSSVGDEYSFNHWGNSNWFGTQPADCNIMTLLDNPEFAIFLTSPPRRTGAMRGCCRGGPANSQSRVKSWVMSSAVMN
jgi:hypothetical protein